MAEIKLKDGEKIQRSGVHLHLELNCSLFLSCRFETK